MHIEIDMARGGSFYTFTPLDAGAKKLVDVIGGTFDATGALCVEGRYIYGALLMAQSYNATLTRASDGAEIECRNGAIVVKGEPLVEIAAQVIAKKGARRHA